MIFQAMILITSSNCSKISTRRRKITLESVALYQAYQGLSTTGYFHVRAYTLSRRLVLFIGFPSPKVPDQVNEKNKGNIHLAPSSPLNVFEAYLKQFQSDFSTFLRLRAEEIKIGGLMVLTFLVRTVSDPFMNDTFEYLSLLAKALSEMSHEGVVEEANIDAFNVPMYVACKEEVEAIIQREGSFKVDKLEIFETNCNTTGNNDETIRNIKNNVRAYMEPLLTSHFGTSLMDELFARFEKHVARRVSQGTVSFSDIVIALTRK